MISRIISLGDALDYSYEDTSRKIDNEFYHGKNGNYHNVMKEGDARRTGCLKTCTQFFNAIPSLRRYHIEIIAKNLEEYIIDDNIEYEKLKFSNSSKKHIRSEVTRIYTEQAMAACPKKYLSKFPALAHEYLPNGSRITLEMIWKEKDLLTNRIMSSNSYDDKIK